MAPDKKNSDKRIGGYMNKFKAIDMWSFGMDNACCKRAVVKRTQHTPDKGSILESNKC